MQKNIGSKLQTSTIAVSGPRQAVAFNSFLEASILLGIFSKMPNKIDASKEKYKTYLLLFLSTVLIFEVCNLISKGKKDHLDG